MKFTLEFTNYCNFKCYFCPHSYYKKEAKNGNVFNRPKGFISTSMFEKALNLIQNECSFLTIGFFGEQTLHPNFSLFSKEIGKLKCRKELNTNFSSKLTSDLIDAYSQYNRIRISLDALDSVVYGKLCPSNLSSEKQFQNVTQNLIQYLNIENRPPIRIIFVRSDFNIHQENAFVNKWQPLLKKGDVITCKSVLSYGGVVLEGKVGKGSCDIYKRPRRTISWNGDISICHLDVNMSLYVGNLITGIDTKKYEFIREQIRQKQGICKNCEGTNHSQKSAAFVKKE
jgi:hypothetical protein